MRQTVEWTRFAKGQLAQIWIDSDDKQLVADAANQIDQELRDHPEAVGESREGNARILFVPPLAADYRVYSDDRIVNVISVWRSDRIKS